MGMQLFTAIMTFIFAGRTMLFVVGLLLGGMLTVSSENVYVVMASIVGGWMFVINGLFGVH